MDSSSGKFLATAAGFAAAAFLLSKVSADEDQVLENFIDYRMGPRTETFFRDPTTGSAVSIRGGSPMANALDDCTFFTPRNFQSTAGSATDSGKTVTGGPPSTVGARINMQLAKPQERAQELRDFQKAAASTNVYTEAAGKAAMGMPVREAQSPATDGTVEGYMAEGDPRRPGANIVSNQSHLKGGRATHPEFSQATMLAGADKRAHELPTQQTAPQGCGPMGTVNEYSGQRLMAANFEYPPGKSALLQPATSLTETLPVGNMSIPGPDGAPMNVQIADRLVYSTLTRARCPGTVDMIRGDLPIPKGGQYSAPAGSPADTLEAGAFAAMFGLEARTAQQTTALILANQAGTRPTLGGADITELTLEAARTGSQGPVLTAGSTAAGAAKTILANEGAGINSNRTGVDTKNGGTTVFTGLAG